MIDSVLRLQIDTNLEADAETDTSIRSELNI
jgi:hypothetical protein